MTQPVSRLQYTYETVASTDGVVTFNITAFFTPENGDLPDGVKGVFVRRATLAADPKQDAFLRVATLADLGTAATSREIALDPSQYHPAAGAYIKSSTAASGLYLSPSLTLAVDNLPVAVQQKKLLEQRVDTLLRDWKTYRDALYSQTLTSFPLFDAAVVAEAKAAYYAAAERLADAQAALAAAAKAKDDANAIKTMAELELARINLLEPYVCPPAAQLTAFLQLYNSYVSATGGRTILRDALTTARNNYGLSAERVSAIDKALSDDLLSYNPLLSGYTTLLAPATAAIQAGCTTLGSQEASATQDRNAAIHAVNSANQNKIDATDLVATRQTQTATALAAVISVCPSFTP